jgi:hypothetical protein
VSSPAAWLPDPTGKHDHRWWDGDQWTEHVADAGQAAVDPLGPGETPPAPSEGPAEPEAPTSEDTAATAGGWADGGRTGDHRVGDQRGTEPIDTGAGGRDTEPVWDRPDAGRPTDADAPPVWGDQGRQLGGREQQNEPPGWGEQGQGQPRDWDQRQQPGGSQQGGWDQRQQPGWDQPGQPGWDQPGQPGQPGQQQGWGQQPAWNQPNAPGGWGQPAPTGRNDGVAVAALIVGILSLLVAWLPIIGLIGALGGVVALVLGFVARGRIKRTGASGSGMALTGIITGVVALLLGTLITIGLFVLGGDLFGESFQSYAECIDETGDEAFCQDQLEQDLFDRFGN